MRDKMILLAFKGFNYYYYLRKILKKNLSFIIIMNSVLYTAYNTLAVKFNEELIEVFPKDIDFKVSLNTIKLIEKTTKRKLFDIVSPQLLMYHEYIRNRDERFFLEKDETEYTVDTESIPIISKLKGYWGTLSENNKDKIWEYVNSLLTLTQKIVTATGGK